MKFKTFNEFINEASLVCIGGDINGFLQAIRQSVMDDYELVDGGVKFICSSDETTIARFKEIGAEFGVTCSIT